MKLTTKLLKRIIKEELNKINETSYKKRVIAEVRRICKKHNAKFNQQILNEISWKTIGMLIGMGLPTASLADDGQCNPDGCTIETGNVDIEEMKGEMAKMIQIVGSNMNPEQLKELAEEVGWNWKDWGSPLDYGKPEKPSLVPGLKENK